MIEEALVNPQRPHTLWWHLDDRNRSDRYRRVLMALISSFKPPSTRMGILKHRPIQTRAEENSISATQDVNAEELDHSYIRPSKHTPKPLRVLRGSISSGGPLRPFRLIRQDLRHLKKRYPSDWTLFNQLVLASAVYVFFTNLLPGVTFASDLYVSTGQNWGTIEVIFSTGLCGIIFSIAFESVLLAMLRS
ncbi:MAG: hypothetical protein Q9187_000260 [Circinaria calcarea]